MADSTRGSERRLASVLCDTETRVDRKTYALVGFTLMAFKYVVEVLLVRFAIGRWWTPTEYFDPWFKSRFAIGGVGNGPLWVPPVPAWLPWVLVLWTLPFIWFGVS